MISRLFYSGLKTLSLAIVASLVLSVSSSGQTPPGYVPLNGLKGWWPFNGNAQDESGNGNNGIIYGTTLTTDRFGNNQKAYSFDGGNNYISVSTAASLIIETDISISFWIYPVSHSMGYIIDRDLCNAAPDWGLHWNNNSVFFRTGISGVDKVLDAGTLAMNTWHHIVITRGGQHFSLYANGALVQTLDISANSFTNTSLPIYFGDAVCNSQTTSPNFAGNIDDIGIWNRSLDQTEVSVLFNGCNMEGVAPLDQNKHVGEQVAFRTKTSEPNAFYQWQSDLGLGFQNLTDAGQYSGATDSVLTVSYLTMMNNQQLFRCILSSDDCTDTTDFARLKVEYPTHVSSLSADLVSISPNPADRYLDLTISRSLNGEEYHIVDYTGKLVLEGTVIYPATKIDLSTIAKGIYFLRVGNEVSKVYRFVRY